MIWGVAIWRCTEVGSRHRVFNSWQPKERCSLISTRTRPFVVQLGQPS
ncbi:UNVERIFIED_CONTAM: hypothetical protein GTU68_060804 [Idotea baltica]|nr:hypothetical protein [Idotea baltica]